MEKKASWPITEVEVFGETLKCDGEYAIVESEAL